MKTFLGLSGCWAVLFVAAIAIAGCGDKAVVESSSGPDLGPTVGSVAGVTPALPIQVEGYGLVIGLPGTGSPSCPPQIRAYLKRYIPVQVPDHAVDVDSFIESNTTAVVRLEGTIPPAASRGDRFDVKVTPLPGSGTLSLRGGWLPKAEVQLRGTFGGALKPLATVEGGVFVNTIGEVEPVLTTGYILGGATVERDYTGGLTLRKPDYVTAAAVRNRLSERYGPGTAKTASPSVIELSIPAEYSRRKSRFLAMVAATFITETAETMPLRINALVEQLATGQDKDGAEIALEAMGRDCLSQLRTLLSSSDEEVRLRAARCMLFLRDDTALATLRQIALDADSSYRAEAFDAVTEGARRNAAVQLARMLLRDSDRAMLLAAYEYLARVGDDFVVGGRVGRSFYLDQVVGTTREAVFVSRSGIPRIAIFGGPLMCPDQFLVESPDGKVVVSSKAGQAVANLMRKAPTSSGMLGPIKTGLDLGEIISVLGAERTADPNQTGLGVPYGGVASLLEQMCAKAVISAEFWPGPLPKISPIIKK